MKYSLFRAAITATALLFSLPSQAGLVSLDWKTAGDGLITSDGTLEWLDLTETAGRSYNDVSGKFGVGQEFEGFRYATVFEVRSLWTAAGGDGHYGGWGWGNADVWDTLAPYVGDLRADGTYPYSVEPGDHYSMWILCKYADCVYLNLALTRDNGSIGSPTASYLNARYKERYSKYQPNPRVGSALIRVYAVPEPASLSLFALAALGFGAIRSRS